MYANPQPVACAIPVDATDESCCCAAARTRAAAGGPSPAATSTSTTAEAVEVAAFAPGGILWDELAFWSTERALRDFIGPGAG